RIEYSNSRSDAWQKSFSPKNFKPLDLPMIGSFRNGERDLAPFKGVFMSAIQTQELDYQIQGMTCSSCVSRVQKQAEKTPGANSAVATPTSETLRLEVERGFSSEHLQENISSIGYGAIPKTDKAALEKSNTKHFGLLLEEWGLVISA